MKIIVCMKEVSEGRGPQVSRRITAEANQRSSSTVNVYDLYALEAAMALRRKNSGVEVAALTVGPEHSDRVLRYALARGVNHAFRISSEGIAVDDPFSVGTAIARFARFFGGALICCGMMSEDSCWGIVPALVAEKLGWPWVNRVIEMAPAKDGASLRVMRKEEQGAILEVECGSPAVLACCPRMEGFDYVSAHRRARMEERPICLYSLEDLGEAVSEADAPIRILRTRNPKPRTKRTAIASKALSGEELMLAMISGTGGKKRDDQIIRGNPGELAGKILDFLLGKGILDPSQLTPDDTNNGSN